MTSSVNWVGNYAHLYLDSDIEITTAYRLSDNRTEFHSLFNDYADFYSPSDNPTESCPPSGTDSKVERQMKKAIVRGLGSVKLESTKATKSPMQCILAKKPDSSDDQLTVIFNQTELDSLEITARSILSLGTFPLKSVVRREEILPLSDNTVKLSIQACSNTSPVLGVSLLRPNFRQLEFHFKPKKPSEIEGKIDVEEGPEGTFNAWIDSKGFDCFRISIHSLK